MAIGLMIKYLIILSIFASLWTCHDALDTLKRGDTLNSSSSLVSASNKFTLEFITKTIEGTDNSYLAIMRIKSTPNKAWIANRDVLIPTSASPVLTLDTNNTLAITHQGGDPFVLFSAPPTNDSSTAVVATILDSGNFVVQELSSVNGSTVKILWQSFDYPVDTFLPGMKLGVDHTTSHIWSLLAWGDRDNPVSSGPYSFDWDTDVHQLKIKRSGVVYWTSGALEDGRFEYILPDVSKARYNFTVVSNENQDYLTFESLNDPNDLEPEWVLYTRGALYEYGAQVDIVRAQNCDGYNVIAGCVRRDRPTGCVGKFGDDFEFKKGSFKIGSSNPSRPANWIGNGTDDCKVTCWQNCDCLGFDFPFGNQTTGSGCRFWSVDCEFVEDVTGGSGTASPSFVLPSSSPQNPPNGRKPNPTQKWFWIGSSIVAALLLMAFCFVGYRLRRRLSEGNNIVTKKLYKLLNPVNSKKPIDDVNGIQNDGTSMRRPDLSVFTYASVSAATSNFSEENKLGQGGFGPVYKGRLETTGQEVAVKRLSKLSGQGTVEFKNELILISELQHTNLVQLFGFCIHEEEKMLIYEYMPNKSLNYFLFDRVRCLRLDWKKRFSIIEGIIQGLLYLHKYSRMKVIHRDLKASNILLDENLNPKIADFGMARIFAHNEFETNTRRIVGTHGYMAPESTKGTVSVKSDVYGFGVLMLEIISGRKNNSFYNDNAVSLVGHVWELWKEGSYGVLMDPTLAESCNMDQFLRCVHVGLLCVEEKAAHRPTMSDVLSMLTNESMKLRPPKKPAFCAGTDVSTATFSNSVVDGR